MEIDGYHSGHTRVESLENILLLLCRHRLVEHFHLEDLLQKFPICVKDLIGLSTAVLYEPENISIHLLPGIDRPILEVPRSNLQEFGGAFIVM